MDLALPGLGNAYNAAAAVSAAVAIGTPARVAVRGLAAGTPPFGRFERLEVDGRHVVLTCSRTRPAWASSPTRRRPRHRHLLFALNDAFADGRDVSWYWDASPSALLPAIATWSPGDAPPISPCGCGTPSRRPGEDPPGFLGLVDAPVAALDRAVAATPSGGTLLVVASYTALLGSAPRWWTGLAPVMPR